jgi:hypothetical protein
MSIYKRATDQYQISKAFEMMEELKNSKPSTCRLSIVKNYKHLKFEGTEHAGVLTHVCVKDSSHEGKCRCICELEFQGWR